MRGNFGGSTGGSLGSGALHCRRAMAPITRRVIKVKRYVLFTWLATDDAKKLEM